MRAELGHGIIAFRIADSDVFVGHNPKNSEAAGEMLDLLLMEQRNHHA